MVHMWVRTRDTCLLGFGLSHVHVWYVSKFQPSIWKFTLIYSCIKSPHVMCTIFIIYSSADGHLGCDGQPGCEQCIHEHGWACVSAAESRALWSCAPEWSSWVIRQIYSGFQRRHHSDFSSGRTSLLSRRQCRRILVPGVPTSICHLLSSQP